MTNKIEQLIEKTGEATKWLSLLLVLVTVVDVLLRYFFKSGSIAVQELEWYFFAALFLFGAASTLASDEHVRVDVLYSKCSKRTQAIINIIGTFIFLLPFCAVVIWASSGFVVQSFGMMEGSPDPGGLPWRFIPKAFIPIGFSLLCIQSLLILLRNIVVVSKRVDSQK